MRSLALWFLVAGLAACSPARFQPDGDREEPDRVGGPLPAGPALEWPEGPPAAGRSQLLQLGATTCATCVTLRDPMRDWARRYGERGVTVAHVFDGRVEDAEALARERDTLAPGCRIAIDPEGAWYDFFHVAATPTFVAVDPEGQVQWAQATARQDWIEEWLEELAHPGIARK